MWFEFIILLLQNMSRSCDKIKHRGVITELKPNQARVCIVRSSACASCGISHVCTRTESKEMIVDIMDSTANEKYRVGDCVTVSIGKDSARTAVFYAFIIPLVCLLTSFIAVYMVFDSESGASVVSVCSVMVYVWILYLKRKTIGRRFSIELVDE